MDIYSPTILVIVGFIIVVLGIGAGMLLGSINEESEPEPDNDRQSPPGARAGRFTPVARIWRSQNGGLLIEMDGKSFISPDGMDGLQRGRVEQAARDLRGWLGMGYANEPAAPSPSAQPNANSTQSNVPPAQPNATSTQSNVPLSQSNATSAPPNVPQPIPVITPLRSVPVVKVDEPTPLASSSKSIVMQIEDVLQDMLPGTPLAGRGIHLAEDPIRGVIVKLGYEQYEGIDSVPDPEIKSFIRSAVAEWEKNQ